MSERALTDSVDETSSRGYPRAFDTILYGGLAVGVLDGLAAAINSGLRGISLLRVFQYIASGLIGRDSYNGGWATAVLGILLHFVVAFGVAAAFYLLAGNFRRMLDHPFITGPLYGIAVYFVMAYIVSPLSQAAQGPFSWTGLVTGIIIHILFVGLPVALIAARSANRK